MQRLKSLSREPALRRAGCALYSMLLITALLYSLLFSGFTNLNGEALQRLSRLRVAMHYGVFLLAAAAVAAECARDWRRALLAAILLALRMRAPVTWQSTMLLDTVMLAALSDLGSEKSNGGVWLAIHAGYAVLLVILRILGWAQDVPTSDVKSVWIFETGHSFGMGHPNNPAIFFMSVWLLLWVMFPPRRWWITLLFFWAGAAMVLASTLCRTVFVLMMVFPLMVFAVNGIARSRHAGLLRCAAAVPLLMLAVSVVLGLLEKKMSQILGGDAFWIRFWEINILRREGLTLLGGQPSTRAFFDNLYFWLLEYCGLIPTIGALGLYACMLIRLANRRRTALLACAVLFALYGLMENAAAYPVYFFVPILVFAADTPIFGKKRDDAGSA